MKVCLLLADVRFKGTTSITHSDESCWEEEQGHCSNHSHGYSLLFRLHGKILHFHSHYFHASRGLPRFFRVEFAGFGTSVLQYATQL